LHELEELRAEKFEQINKLREKNKNKIEELKQNYERELQMQKKRLEVINKYNDDLKEQLIDLQKKTESVDKKEHQLNALASENHKLHEALTFKNSNLETHLEMFDKNKHEIEKLSSIQLELEQKLAIVYSEKSNLFSFKETFPYVLKEALKWLSGKKSNLKHSLRNLNEDDYLLIKSCFEDSGIPLNL
jgi:chromosome segregation ATPase